jgi:hypothetical protein
MGLHPYGEQRKQRHEFADISMRPSAVVKESGFGLLVLGKGGLTNETGIATGAPLYRVLRCLYRPVAAKGSKTPNISASELISKVGFMPDRFSSLRGL